MKFATTSAVVAFGFTRAALGQAVAHDTTTPSVPTAAVTRFASTPAAPLPTSSQPVSGSMALVPPPVCNPPCASGQLCGTNNQCLQLVPIAPYASPEVPEAPEEPLKPLPNLAMVVLPEASLTFGNDLFATAEAGLGLQLRVQRLAFGLHIAKGPSMDGWNDYQSCQDTFCAEKRKRYGLNLEYAVYVRRFGQAWVGLDVEKVRVNGWYDGQGGSWDPSVQRTGLFFTAKAGFEFSKRWSHGLIGISPFLGLTYGGVTDANGVGLTIGARAPFGIF